MLVATVVGAVVAGCAPRPAPSTLSRAALPVAPGPPPTVDAHDGSLVQDGATFWLYGTAYSCGFALATVGTRWCGVRAFSSTDLTQWSDRGLAIAPTELWQQRCAPPLFGCFRPHVARPAAGGPWVMWVNSYDTAAGYHVLVAHSPAGPWDEAAPPVLSMGGDHPASRGDEDVFVDSTGVGWIAYTLIENARPVDIVVERLTDDLTSGSGVAVRLGLGEVEAPSLFERDGRFFLTYSDPACPYCAGTRTGMAEAPSPLGPWRVNQPISARSCDGQPSGVTQLRLADDTVWLYVADRWDRGRPNQAVATLWWEPLRFGASGLPLPLRCTSPATAD